MTNVAILGVVLFLAACATVNVSKDYTLRETSREGLLVVSVSGEGLAKGETPVWMYRQIDGRAKGEIITGYLREPLDWNNPSGRLAYVALAPGRYEFYRAGFERMVSPGHPYWTTTKSGTVTGYDPNYAGLTIAQYTTLDARPFSVPFEIRAGEGTYLGNLHFVWNEAAHKGEVVLLNRPERDLALLHQRLPNIGPTEVRRAQE